jgi:hypothetical protein
MNYIYLKEEYSTRNTRNSQIPFVSIIFVFLLFLLLDNEILSQKGINSNICSPENHYKNNSNNELLNTPFGKAAKSKFHYVGSGHYLSINQNSIQIINTKTGFIVDEFNRTGLSELGKAISNNENQHNDLNSKSVNGWITHAFCQIYSPGVHPPIYFSSNWTVPSPPLNNADQLIYIFIGLSGASIQENGNSTIHIVQPVLQWGISPAGGGRYWAICNWYVSNNNQFFYDSLIKVSTGTELKGEIKLISLSDSLYNYNSSFENYGPGLLVKNLPVLEAPYVTLEGFNVDNCNEFPSDEKIRMRDINIKTELGNPDLLWHTFEETNHPVIDCGQYTEIVNTSSIKGEIAIHFYSPSDIDNFKDIHIYPNPFEDQIHISPLKPISKCEIKLYNSIGKVIYSRFYYTLDFEFDLDLQRYSSGFYILKFSYNNKSHTFKLIKK